MKIWLDDVRPMPGDFDHHAYTFEDAIGYLKTNEVTFISLDHDLGDNTLYSGYDVACWIERHAQNGTLKPLQWGCHSQNPVGRKNIIAAMENADRYWKDNS